MKVISLTRLGDFKLVQCSLSATYHICHDSLEHSLRIHSFRTIGTCLTIKVLVTWVKFLEPPEYCCVVNCIFTFYTANAFGCFPSIMAQFKHIECSNVKHVSSPTTVIQLSSAGTFLTLNSFGHMIYALQISTIQNIAKILTHLYICEIHLVLILLRNYPFTFIPLFSYINWLGFILTENRTKRNFYVNILFD